MSFAVIDKADAAVVEIKGKFLGALEREAFNESIDSLKERGITNIVIDLSKADFMDSTAVGLIMRSLTTMRNAGGNVHLSALNKRIKNLFLMTRLLGPVFDDYETSDDAIKAFASASA
jgi:anti-sigma B factor antagonist